MPGATVRINPRAHKTLRQLARQTGQSMPQILDRAIEEYRRRTFLEGLSEDFTRLRRDRAAWNEELKERAAWDATLADDLEHD
jgi:predicted transcriptional regulator